MSADDWVAVGAVLGVLAAVLVFDLWVRSRD